jgi:4-carboxymuconolactone decarboxylase
MGRLGARKIGAHTISHVARTAPWFAAKIAYVQFRHCIERSSMSDDDHDALTRRTARRLFGKPKRGEGAYALWRDFNPALAREFSRFYVGRLYAREVLSQKQRELCAVAALAVLNYQEELAIHAGAALNCGATPEEVAEVVFQMATYGGAPCTVEGLRTLKRVLEERGLWQPAP